MSKPFVDNKWSIGEPGRTTITVLSRELGIPPVVAGLLAIRNVLTSEEGRRFLEPGRQIPADPSLLSDMDRAVDRLEHARQHGERVLVFGDYDVDGIAGAVLLKRALKRHGVEHCDCAMPNRLSDGYGLRPEAVRHAHDQGTQLIVTVDNGIGAYAAAEEAGKLGIDLIITDHHEITGEMPEARAIVNPKREGPEGPMANICGAAVAFKLAHALTGDTVDLDLAALATVADIVPLHGENRTLTALGLDALNSNPKPGIAALCRVAGVRPGEIRAENIAFQLGPRINASGRMGHSQASFDLLCTESADEARRLAAALNEDNQTRRRVENDILEDIEEELEHTYRESQRSLVVARRGWHPGVIGIVASKLQQSYCRPVVLIAVDGQGLGRASARSSPDFNLMEGFEKTASLLVRYGGHRAAAGMTIEEGNIAEFKEGFEAAAAESLPPGVRQRELPIDALVSFSEIDGQLLRAIERLEPFGHGNPSPVFASLGVEVMAKSARELRGGHLKLSFKQGPRVLPAIGFNMAGKMAEGRLPETLDIAFTPQFNTWNGQTTIQLLLKDLRPPPG